MKKTSVILISLLLVLVPVASASIFSDFLDKILPATQRANAQVPMQAIVNPELDDYNTFMQPLYAMNTPENVAKLSGEMKKQGVSSVRVNIKELNQDFYVVHGLGIVASNSYHDAEYTLTKQQVLKIYNIIRDGDITFAESIKMQLILREIL